MTAKIIRKCVVKSSHHDQLKYAFNRPHYRQGRKLTAVKVYTVNNESQHLLIFGVPKIKLKDEVYRLASRFGHVKSLTLVDNYPQDDDHKFTDIFHVQYRRIQAARYAKKQLDERCFFGGILHVCYAPELETIAETRVKLIQRRREVMRRIEVNRIEAASGESEQKPTGKLRYLQRSKKHPAIVVPQPSSSDVQHNPTQEVVSTIHPPLIVSQLPVQVPIGANNPSLFMNVPEKICGLMTYNNTPHMNQQQQHLWNSTGTEHETVATNLEHLSNSTQVQCKRVNATNTLPNVLSVDCKKSLTFIPRQIVKKPVANSKRIVYYKK